MRVNRFRKNADADVKGSENPMLFVHIRHHYIAFVNEKKVIWTVSQLFFPISIKRAFLSSLT